MLPENLCVTQLVISLTIWWNTCHTFSCYNSNLSMQNIWNWKFKTGFQATCQHHYLEMLQKSILSRDWAALGRDTAHSKPVIQRSKFSVSPACHNQVTWLATSAQQLTLLAVARSKQLCQAPPPWRHNAMPWWRHLQNITGFRNLELDSLSDVKSTW